MSAFLDAQQTKLKEDIKEAFYSAGYRVLKPIVSVLNDVYPSAKRLPKSPIFDQDVFDEHDRKFKSARNHLYEQRNLVQKKWLLRYVVSVGPGTDVAATQELRSVIVDGALDRLYEVLIAYTPMLVPAEYQKEVMNVVHNVHQIESKALAEKMLKYSAVYAPTVENMDKELD